MIAKALDQYFPKLANMPALKQDLVAISNVITLEAGTVILKQGGYVKLIPLLLSGLAKVFKEDENGHEVLLYYIKPGESCVMSVTTMVRNETSQVKAIIEEDAQIVVIPSDKAMMIAKKYPKWNEFIYDLFNVKFEELLNVIKILTFSNKDIRLLEYLKKEASLKGNKLLHTTHQHIAYDLGSSREVISRLLKKLENEGKVILKQGTIKVL
ncbi:Crp/Fnr family transcriptional regulator [uncultured Dokdonia sp.]|uniref:Crp/Fnr family transcriptional regulator n=1 Tax=uncultured Dokdonia sp. TaxID=575653 RepID=UPI0026368DE7|nr:Crp/Fnr family transcriptional regulator [uncultured Dokdonia sp.]